MKNIYLALVSLIIFVVFPVQEMNAQNLDQEQKNCLKNELELPGWRPTPGQIEAAYFKCGVDLPPLHVGSFVKNLTKSQRECAHKLLKPGDDWHPTEDQILYAIEFCTEL